MNKKTKLIIAAVVLLIAVVGGVYGFRQLNQDKNDKAIEVIIMVDDKKVFDETVDTNAGTLADLLKEMKEDKDIKLNYENSEYGMYITGMGKDKLYKEDKAKNKFWTFTSDTNKQCTEADFCPGADDLKIANEDTFVFTLVSFAQ
ncbi:hypothetical protein A4S06_07990 [Erysipelotrichaceae bacterium MTC7]|nr:hypothetical protein A4S06_07990 [Erysipelotrichaceae bacterium MTC7]